MIRPVVRPQASPAIHATPDQTEPNVSTHPFAMRAVAGAILFTLLYSPILGGINGTLAAAQAVQNTTTNYQYDANGNLTQITDPLGHVTNYSYDGLNRRRQQLQPAPVTGAARPAISFGYDGLDQATSVTDPRNLVTSYTIDGLGNQTALSSPDTGLAGKTYDAAGNLKTSTDARGKTTSYNYDALNRITSIVYASGTPTAFEYDGGAAGAPNAKGRLTRMTDESGQTTYAYDPAGRLLDKAQTVDSGVNARTFMVNYTYGNSGYANGKLAHLTYPSGNQVNIGYDAAGRINSLTLNPADGTTQLPNIGITTPLLSNIAYSPFGRATGWDWGNSTFAAPNTYARTFDLDDRLTGYPLGNLAAGGVYRTLTYDAANRIAVTTHSGSGTPAALDQSYGYDNLDRLVNFVGNGATQGFQYDATGNRIQATFGSTIYNNTIAANSNRLTAAAGPVAKTNTYDAAGNLVSDGTISYAYSDRGRMKSATVGGNTVSYAYNGIGQRVKKSGPTSLVASGANFYAYDEEGKLLGEYDSSGKVIQETVYLAGQPVAVLKQSGTGSGAVTNVYYVYADHINTPRVIGRASDNAIVWHWITADPFGMQQPNENPSNLGTFAYNLRFPGQYFDKETNLHYNYFRDYDSSTGRYVQSDPIGNVLYKDMAVQSLAGKGTVVSDDLAEQLYSKTPVYNHSYAYVENDPINYTDPEGLARKPIWRCILCNAPHGGLFGRICPSCNSKLEPPPPPPPPKCP